MKTALQGKCGHATFFHTLVMSLVCAGSTAFAADTGGSVFDLVEAGAAKADIHVEPLRDGLYVVQGSGGNITLLAGADGKFLVDAGIAKSNPTLASVLQTYPGNYRYVVNTHWHWDHSDGDGWLHQLGATVIATPATKRHLTTASTVSAWNHTFDPVARDGVPTLLLTAPKTFTLDGQHVEVRPLMSSHTDGDIAVYFQEANVLATGDTFWNGYYPFIDDEHGGGIDGTIAVIDDFLKMVNDRTLIVPGHGPIGHRGQLQAYRDMLVAVRDKVSELKARGATLDESIADKPTAAFDAQWGGFLVKSDLFTTLVYQSTSPRHRTSNRTSAVSASAPSGGSD